MRNSLSNESTVLSSWRNEKENDERTKWLPGRRKNGYDQTEKERDRP